MSNALSGLMEKRFGTGGLKLGGGEKVVDKFGLWTCSVVVVEVSEASLDALTEIWDFGDL